MDGFLPVVPWLIAIALIAVVAAAGVSLSRHHQKSEWHIFEEVVEETQESG